MIRRWGIVLLVLGAGLVLFMMKGTSSPRTGVSSPSSGRAVMLRMVAVEVSPASAPSLLGPLAVDPRRHGRSVLRSAQRQALEAQLTALVGAGTATALSSPTMLVQDGAGGSIELSSTTGQGRGVFVVEATATIVDGGVSLDTMVSQSSATGPIELALQDLGMRGRRATARAMPPIGPADAIVIWLAQEQGGVLVEITATPQ